MGLSFLTPLLLGGAALVAVPLVLHLIMRRKPVKLEFPALRFLKNKAVANRRRLRLNHLFLLLLRMAALAFLALALARPTLRGAGWLADGEGPVAAVFIFDTAPRMLLCEANRTRLEQAASMAKVLFEKLPPLSKVAVIDTSGGAVAFSPTLAAATTRIERLAASTPITSLSAAIAEGYKLLDTSRLVRHELYLFTDCSQGAWNGAAPLELSASHPDTSLLVVDVGASSSHNFAIEAAELSGNLIAAGSPLSIAVTTNRTGPDANRAVTVEMLNADGQYVRRAIKPVVWKQGARGQVDFEVAGLEPGVRQGRVVIDGSDDLEADNVRSFTVEVGTPARVLVAAPAPAERTGLFMMQALSPSALRMSGKAKWIATLIDTAQLEATPWDGVSGIVLVDPPPLPARVWELLGQWVAGGRGLVAWLGPRAVGSQSVAGALPFNSEMSQSVLGGRIVRVWRSPDGSNFLSPSSLDHPMLAAFRRVGDAVPWQDFPVHRHWEFEPLFSPAHAEGGTEASASDPTAAHPVAAYRNGLPALLEHRVGQGTVLTITTPVSQSAGDPDAWNTLATGFEPWPFVMLANETLLYAIDTADDRNIIAGKPAVIHLAKRDVPAAFVRTPGGDDFPSAVDQKRGTITVTATQVPGNYTIRSGGEVGGISTGFSANLDASATDASRLREDSLALIFGVGQRMARTEADLVRDVNLERIGAELGGWIIMLVALAMAGDWIVANRFYAPRDDSAPTVGPAAAFTALRSPLDASAVQPLPKPAMEEASA